LGVGTRRCDRGGAPSGRVPRARDRARRLAAVGLRGTQPPSLWPSATTRRSARTWKRRGVCTRRSAPPATSSGKRARSRNELLSMREGKSGRQEILRDYRGAEELGRKGGPGTTATEFRRLLVRACPFAAACWSLVYGPWFMVPGLWSLVSGLWSL